MCDGLLEREQKSSLKTRTTAALFAPNFHDARAASSRAACECLDNYIRLCWPEAIIIADSFRNYKFLRDLAWRASVPACQRARWYREEAGWLLRVRVPMAGKVWQKERREERREKRRTKSEGDERRAARENVNWGDLLGN